MGVLPKGQRWPNTCTPAITTVNSRLRAYARANADWLHFLDVGDQFLTHQARSLIHLQALTRHEFLCSAHAIGMLSSGFFRSFAVQSFPFFEVIWLLRACVLPHPGVPLCRQGRHWCL